MRNIYLASVALALFAFAAVPAQAESGAFYGYTPGVDPVPPADKMTPDAIGGTFSPDTPDTPDNPGAVPDAIGGGGGEGGGSDGDGSGGGGDSAF